MKNLAILPLLAFGLMGCGSDDKVEAAKIKEGYDRKSYTIDDVPAAQREMVRSMMKQGRAAPPASKP